MNTALVILTLAGYFVGAGKLIRWSCKENDVEVPNWWDVIGMLLWPRILARIVVWLIPDSLGWPEPWIAMGIWMAMLFVVLKWWFKLPTRWAMGVWLMIFVFAVVTSVRAFSLMPPKVGLPGPPPAAPQSQP